MPQNSDEVNRAMLNALGEVTSSLSQIRDIRDTVRELENNQRQLLVDVAKLSTHDIRFEEITRRMGAQEAEIKALRTKLELLASEGAVTKHVARRGEDNVQDLQRTTWGTAGKIAGFGAAIAVIATCLGILFKLFGGS